MHHSRQIEDHAHGAGRSAVDYAFTIAPDAFESVRDSLEVAVERPWLYRVELNGSPVEFPEGARWWDEEVRKTSIADVTQPGRNVLRMTARPFHILCEIAPVYVMGEFALRQASPGFAIGGWFSVPI